MERIKAQESLEDPKYCWGLDQVAFEDLLVRAGFDRREAHKAALKHGWQRMDAGEPF
jgi:hypothetical protein